MWVYSAGRLDADAALTATTAAPRMESRSFASSAVIPSSEVQIFIGQKAAFDEAPLGV